MSLRDKSASYAGYQAIVEGVDSGRAPSTLAPTALAWLVNGTCRGGYPMCRPGWGEFDLTFLGEDNVVDAAVEAAFKTGGRFQGAWPYLDDLGDASIIALIGGRVFEIDVSTRNVQLLSGLTGPLVNVPTAPRAWFVQAENFLVIQNGGQDAALIYDGAVLRRSGYPGVQEVPPGSVMEYNNGRLWVASPDGDKFVAGDLVYSVTGTRADVLGFTENTYLNGGGFFVVPAQAGRITAMRSVAVQDTPLGQGPLQVITTRGAFSVNAPFNRDEWQNTRSSIVTISMLAAGAVSQASTTLVNGDIWFRASDGIRSFMFAQRDHGTWVNTPLSREVGRALDHDSPTLLEYASSTLFDNRFLCTTQPSQVLDDDGNVRGIVHAGLVALDFAPVSSMFNRTQPLWDGVWTGLRILQVLVTDSVPSRAWLFALDDDNEVTLWEMSRTDRFDTSGATRTRIVWSLETPSYGFDTGGWNLRELGYGDFWVNRLVGTVDLVFTYRCDDDPLWQTWASVQVCASFEDCDKEACEVPGSYQEQYRPRMRLTSPASTCDASTGKPRNQGYRFATRVEVTGPARLSQLRLVARDLPEEVEGACPPVSCTLAALTGCLPDDYTYSSTS